MKEPDIAKNVRKEGLTHTDSAGNKLLNNRTVPSNLISLPDETPSDDSDVTIQANSIPDELKKPKQWVMWDKESRNGKPTKVPYTVDNVPAKADDPSTWNSFDACKHALNSSKYHFNGIGFEFSKTSGITGIDIDHCLNPDTGEIEKWAAEKVQQFDSYTEVSPSGDGLHIFVKGVKPGERSKRGNVEMYDSGRFFTVTGAHVKGTPFSIEPRQKELHVFYAELFDDDRAGGTVAPQPTTGSADAKLLAKAASAKNGKRFERLYHEGDISDYPSASEADLALCSTLAFRTYGDQGRVDRLFRSSALFRPKWDEQHGAQTYGQMTIEKACSGLEAGYARTVDYNDHEQYFDGQRFVPKRVADVVLNSYHFFTFADTEEIYVYDAREGIYRPGGEQIIRDETQRFSEIERQTTT
jgi:primase-polymerase (primpol)-like protein